MHTIRGQICGLRLIKRSSITARRSDHPGPLYCMHFPPWTARRCGEWTPSSPSMEPDSSSLAADGNSRMTHWRWTSMIRSIQIGGAANPCRKSPRALQQPRGSLWQPITTRRHRGLPTPSTLVQARGEVRTTFEPIHTPSSPPSDSSDRIGSDRRYDEGPENLRLHKVNRERMACVLICDAPPTISGLWGGSTRNTAWNDDVRIVAMMVFTCGKVGIRDLQEAMRSPNRKLILSRVTDL
ncbi:hypothetical protein V2J09_004202 [Rumex salicifolius]